MSAKVIKLFMDLEEARKSGCSIHVRGLVRICHGTVEQLFCHLDDAEPGWYPLFYEEGDLPETGWLPNHECDCVEATTDIADEEQLASVSYANFDPQCENPFFSVRRRPSRPSSGPCRVFDFQSGAEMPVGR